MKRKLVIEVTLDDEYAACGKPADDPAHITTDDDNGPRNPTVGYTRKYAAAWDRIFTDSKGKVN